MFKELNSPCVVFVCAAPLGADLLWSAFLVLCSLRSKYSWGNRTQARGLRGPFYFYGFQIGDSSWTLSLVPDWFVSRTPPSDHPTGPSNSADDIRNWLSTPAPPFISSVPQHLLIAPPKKLPVSSPFWGRPLHYNRLPTFQPPLESGLLWEPTLLGAWKLSSFLLCSQYPA